MAQINGLLRKFLLDIPANMFASYIICLVLKCILFERTCAVFLYTALTKELIKLFAITAGL